VLGYPLVQKAGKGTSGLQMIRQAAINEPVNTCVIGPDIPVQGKQKGERQTDKLLPSCKFILRLGVESLICPSIIWICFIRSKRSLAILRSL
tara:strand:- start:211 stop:486 length:276 start_codon:yes stop_codon:yes gene_type:complete